MCILFCLSAAIVLALQFGIPAISMQYGPAVEARFVERLNIIPGPKEVPLDLQNLKDWIIANSAAARGYVCPVLFPLDFIFMLALAAATAVGAALTARHAPWISDWPRWIWFIIPVIYLVADFVEDVLLIGVLRKPASLAVGNFAMLARATSIKIKTATAAIILLVILSTVASVRVYLFQGA